MDLLEFPTILFYETGYSTYVLRQASRRSWRIGQKRPVRVRFFYIDNGSDKKLQKTLMRRTQDQAEMFDPFILGSMGRIQNPLEGL